MAESVLLRGPSSVANLSAAAGVTTTVDGWWPCLDIIFRTPVPPSITKITAQVREQGGTTIAETVLTSAELAAGTAKIVNGVSVGQHLQVRLSPAGAPGLPFQATPWVEVTTSWDALMAALDGLSLGCVKEVCGVGVPTRTDLPNGSRYTREDISQLWRYVIEPSALCFVLDVSGYDDAGAAFARLKAGIVNSLSQIAVGIPGAGSPLDLAVVACNTVATSITRRAASRADIVEIIAWVEALTEAGSIRFDAAAALTEAKVFYDATDAAITRRPCPLLWSGVTDSTGTVGSWPSYLAAAEAVAASMPDTSIYSIDLSGFWGTTYTAALDNTPDDGLPVATTLEDLEDALSVPVAVISTWVLMSDLTSIRLNGVEVEGSPRSMDFVGAAVNVTSDGEHGVTVEITGAALLVKNEGSSVEAATESINFVGAALDATTDGAGHVTVTLATDTDGALAANSDDKLATQKATKTAIATSLAAALAYTDTVNNARSWKNAVRAASTANGTLATAFENGDALDGVTLATGDRILLKDQSTASQNGIYTVNASGAPTRATDADSAAEMVNASCYVSEGTVNADRQYTCTTNAPITLGSTSLTFVQSGSGSTYTADGTTLDLTGTTFSVKAGGIGTSQLANDAVNYAKLQNVSATSRVLGRKTASAGDAEECTLSEILDFIGSAAQGDVLYRGASVWARLGAGTSGQVLQTNGTGANPSWATPTGGSISISAGAGLPYVYTQPPFANVTSLLHFDGSHGGTTITEQATGSNSWSVVGSAALSTTQIAVGSASLSVPSGANSSVKTTNNSAWDVGSGDWTVEFRYKNGGTPQAFARIFATRDGDTNQGIALTTNGSTLSLDMSANGSTFGIISGASLMALSSVIWNYCIVQRRGNLIEAWINGSPSYTSTISGSVYYNAGDTVVIGGNATGTSRSINGYIDEFRFTKGVAVMTPGPAFPNS
jgi:hypothetical protein